MTEPFPSIDGEQSPSRPPINSTPTDRTTTSQNEEGAVSRIARKAGKSFSESRPPVGMFHGWGIVASEVPSLKDIEVGNYQGDGWSGVAQRKNSQARRESVAGNALKREATIPTIPEGQQLQTKPEEITKSEKKEEGDVAKTAAHDPSEPYENGYQFPPKHTWKQSLSIGAKGAFKFVITPFGFLLTIYSLNIVAWGGMLFLILCRAAPAMNPPSCPDYNDKNCPAQIWLEIDSQILNALFCVTGLGLIPWRFRDLYFLIKWRYFHNHDALRKLAGIHRNWFRLQGSEEIPPTWTQTDEGLTDASLPPTIKASSLALPIRLSPDAPLTGFRASPSKYYMLDLIVWGWVWNSFLQIALCGAMWGFNRFTRPSWVTGFLIALACIVSMAAGWLVGKEGKRVKKVEGVPVSEADMKILAEMAEKERARGTNV